MDLRNKELLNPLIQRCLRNERRAQNDLYKAVFPYAMNIAMRYAKDQDESVIIVNDAFYKMFTYLKNFEMQGGFNIWVRKIVVNTAIDHYNSKQKFKEVFISMPEDVPEIPDLDSILDHYDAEHILQHIQNLPSSYRIIFSLFAVDGFSHKEIAEQLGISESASKSAYHKSKIKLKQALSPASFNLNTKLRYE